ncbi:MAG: RpiR-family transcriptional regulator [Firmicutes bacterium]|nr:RpiR-family transcriptional regulator [Bacillota bacterium]
MTSSLVDRIKQYYDKLSPSHRTVGEFLVREPRLLAFGTAASIGRAAGVSEASVIRLAHQGTGVMGRVLEHDVHLIRHTLKLNQAEVFDRAVATLSAARRIFVTGARSSYGVAHFFWYTLRIQVAGDWTWAAMRRSTAARSWIEQVNRDWKRVSRGE